MDRSPTRKVTLRKCPICENYVETWMEKEPNVTLTFDMQDHYREVHRDFYDWFNRYSNGWGTLLVFSLPVLGLLALKDVVPGYWMWSWLILLASVIGNYLRKRNQFTVAWRNDMLHRSEKSADNSVRNVAD
jgi:hypothetical protein